MSYYFNALKNFSVFHTRSSRTDYWMFVLVNALVFAGLWIGLVILGGALVDSQIVRIIMANVLLGYPLVIFLPHIALIVRRLHDSDKSGLWLLIALVPYIGAIVLFVFMILPGTKGPNKYGAESDSRSVSEPVDI